MLSWLMYVYRCVLTTIDPATGVKDPEQEPLRTLRKYTLTLFLVSVGRVFVSTILSFFFFFPLLFRPLFSFFVPSNVDIVWRKTLCCARRSASLLSWESIYLWTSRARSV